MLRRTVVLFALAVITSLFVLVIPAQPTPRVEAKPSNEIDNSIGMTLVRIPPGKFEMGSPKMEQDNAIEIYEEWAGEKATDRIRGWYLAEGPQHEVEISKPFWMGMHEVTQKQFRAVMGYNPSYFSHDGKGKTGLKPSDYSNKPTGGRGMTPADTSNFPVENVSWEEAKEFCEKLTKKENKERLYRLPTEAEWEYCCRGGASSYHVFYYGNSLSSNQANFNGKYPYGKAVRGGYLERTCEVGRYKKNGFGLYDMHGNVWEWCSDWYGNDYYTKSPRLDPQGPSEGSHRVSRGGCWWNFGASCRSAARIRRALSHRDYYIGFRIVCIPSVK